MLKLLQTQEAKNDNMKLLLSKMCVIMVTKSLNIKQKAKSRELFTLVSPKLKDYIEKSIIFSPLSSPSCALFCGRGLVLCRL